MPFDVDFHDVDSRWQFLGKVIEAGKLYDLPARFKDMGIVPLVCLRLRVQRVRAMKTREMDHGFTIDIGKGNLSGADSVAVRRQSRQELPVGPRDGLKTENSGRWKGAQGGFGDAPYVCSNIHDMLDSCRKAEFTKGVPCTTAPRDSISNLPNCRRQKFVPRNAKCERTHRTLN